MRAGPTSMILASLMLAGCVSGDSLEGERTVFANPYAVPVIDRSGIGPQCDVERGRDATCLGVPVTRRGYGVRIGENHIERLSRAQRRILRQRAELLKARTEELAKAAQPPPEPTLPTAAP